MTKQNIISKIISIISLYGQTDSINLKLNEFVCQVLINDNNTDMSYYKETYTIDGIIINNYYRGKDCSMLFSYDNINDKILIKILNVLKQYEKRKVRNKYLSIL